MKHFLKSAQYSAADTAVAWILAVSAIAWNLCGCASTQPSSEPRSVLIGKLKTAEDIDLQNVRSSRRETAQASDSTYQAYKAQKVIDQLQQGQEVPQPIIDDALDVPPESISGDARMEMIKELKAAEKCDELGEQTHDPGNDWLAWDSYREQRSRAAELSKALQIGADVPWTEIQQTLQISQCR
jgi:hypothetical protein